MPSKLLTIGLPLGLVSAAAYQFILSDLLFVNLGVGRSLQPLQDFPYECHRLHDPRLHACEDMWLSEGSRQLFLACSASDTRREWAPNVGRLNASGRSLVDAILVMDLDRPDGDGFAYKELEIPGFSQTTPGDEPLSLIGLTGRDNSDGSIELLVINNKPALDQTTREPIDNTLAGANTTIEHFVTEPDAAALEHRRTYAHELIATPNNVAWDENDSFYFTNDHGTSKVGWKYDLSPFLGYGDVTHCQYTSTENLTCKTAAPNLRFPNGLIKARDNLVYVPSSASGDIKVFEIQADRSLRKVADIDIGYGLDNLSQDADGNIFVPGFPKAIPSLKAFDDPMNVFPPSTILKVWKTEEGGFAWTKELEDDKGEALGMSTVAVRDGKSGSLFVGSVASPFLTVCKSKEPRN
ncbi:hypothetical protein Q7P37_009290 [Cladosporium fusiforme]